jgi:anti-sigma-K factor RskA
MNANTHPTREEDFDLLALGALEGDERRAIESHVGACASCARKLAEARNRIALLGLASPFVKPSGDVKARLIQQIRAEAAGTPQVPPRLRDEPSDGRYAWARWWNAVLIPVAAVLVFATVYLWRQNQIFDQQLAILRATVQEQQDQLDEDLKVADLIAARDTIVVPLAPQSGMPQGSARVVYNAHSGILVYDGQLDKAPADKSYVLWLVPATGNPINAGVFNPSTGKTSHWVIKLPAGTVPKAFAVTLEPAGGAPQPTGPKVLVGPVS